MFCPNCGTKNKEGAKFCKKCGQSLKTKGQKLPHPKTIHRYVFLLLAILVGAAGIFVIFSKKISLSEIFLFKKQHQSEWVSWDIQDGLINQKTKQLIKESVLENEYLNPTSKKEKEEYIWSYSIVFLQVEGNWAILSAAPVSKSNGKLVNTEGIPLLGRNINGHWEVVHPQGDKFLLWVSLIPDSLLSMETKANLVLRYGGENE